MARISPTSSASPSLQQALSQAKVAQAQREAEQAESKAHDLRAQADSAEIDAQESQHQVSRVRQEQKQLTYSTSIQKPGSESSTEAQELLAMLYKAKNQYFGIGNAPLKNPSNAMTVVNTQGQTTGRIVNTSA